MTQYKLSFMRKANPTIPILKKPTPSPTIKIVKYADNKNYITNLPSNFTYYVIYFYDSSNTLVDISNDLSNVKFNYLTNINSKIPGSTLDVQYSDFELINSIDSFWYWDPVKKALIYAINGDDPTKINMFAQYSLYYKIFSNKCLFSETSLIKDYKRLVKPFKNYIKYKDYKTASLSTIFINSLFGGSLSTYDTPLKSLTFMNNLTKIEIIDGYELIKDTYDSDKPTYLKITFKFKDKDNNIIIPSNSNLSMFRYEISSYANKKYAFMYSENYNFKKLKVQTSPLLLDKYSSNENNYCINSDNSLSMFADIGSTELGFDLTIPKCAGIISYIQFSLGHIFASTIKIDYLNSKITIV